MKKLFLFTLISVCILRAGDEYNTLQLTSYLSKFDYSDTSKTDFFGSTDESSLFDPQWFVDISDYSSRDLNNTENVSDVEIQDSTLDKQHALELAYHRFFTTDTLHSIETELNTSQNQEELATSVMAHSLFLQKICDAFLSLDAEKIHFLELKQYCANKIIENLNDLYHFTDHFMQISEE